jgi:phospholipid/cholesterol/gamma-HCH transport system substrate-binding protein
MRGLLSPLIKLVMFLVVTSLATYVLAATIANTSFGETESYKANFTDASGLQLGDDVRVAGVRVGSVEGIKIVDKNIAQVKFSLSKDRPLPTSARAKLRYRNLVGQRYIDISAGPGDSNAVLKPGGVLPVTQTQPAVDLTVLFQGFKPLFQGLAADQINQLSNEIIMTLQGESGSLDLLLRTLAELTNGLADKDAVIGSVIDNLTSVLTTIGDRDNQLSDLIVKLQQVISGFANDKKAIFDAIDGITNLETVTNGLVKDVRAPLKEDIKELTGLVANLNQGSDAIEFALQNLAPTIGALIRTASYGSWFNFYVCSLSGTITLPGGAQVLHLEQLPDSQQPRCK